jgi:hypothetical protein
MTFNSLEDLFVDQLRDLYSAETQLIKALPKMAKAPIPLSFSEVFSTTWSRPRGTRNGWSAFLRTSAPSPRARLVRPWKG